MCLDGHGSRRSKTHFASVPCASPRTKGKCTCIHTRSAESRNSRRVSDVVGSPSVLAAPSVPLGLVVLSAPRRPRAAADCFGITRRDGPLACPGCG